MAPATASPNPNTTRHLNHQMNPHFRKLLYVPNEEDTPPLLQTPANVSAAAPPSASISKPPRPPLANAPFDSSVGLAVLVLLTALFFMGFFSLYIRRFAEGSEEAAAAASSRRRPRRDPAGPSPPNSTRAPPGRPSCRAARKGLDPAVIRSLPAFAYGGGGAKYQADCAVCLSDFEEEEVVKAIPWCSHVFHAECIDRWLCAHASCPVCRGARLTEASGGSKAGGAEGSSAVGSTEARSASGLGGGSTAASGDTCLEIGDGGGVGLSVRRSSSWSSLGEGGRSLQRMMSF
ncbi:RING-H2 finger protein ATL57 [Syzygium oleosum]|uniref:RING-H2 finger protein ATL57 n=1 Tax=Syzygium oleosum TaxID=219896 RepID=UPI0024B94C9E|nr:RING-H2 finger protein ATL57 [Syzygium oleosum]